MGDNDFTRVANLGLRWFFETRLPSISENFQYSLCRLTGNQSAVDLTNLYTKERSLLSYYVVLAQLDRALHYECEGYRFEPYRQLPS